jgi:HD superfamily phosphohydrolase
MFPKEHLDLFYSSGNISEDVKESYFTFICYICTKVSKNWDAYLKQQTLTKDTATIGTNLTPSDEAYALWRVKYWYDDIKKDSDKYQELNKNDEEYKKWKKEQMKNPLTKRRQSVRYLHEYSSIHNKINEHRRNMNSKVLWDNIFWDTLWEKVESNDIEMQAK